MVAQLNSLLALIVERSWLGLSGLITSLLIAFFLTPDAQGWYYVFVSLAKLSVLFDLGLSVVLVHISASLASALEWGSGSSMAGPSAPRFRSVVRQSVIIYMSLAVSYVTVMLPVGMLFFMNAPDADSHLTAMWLAPWAALVLATGGAMLCIPFLAFIEGTGRVAEVSSVRLIYGLIGSLSCWLLLAAGGQLWAVLMAPIAMLLVSLYWLALRCPVMLSEVWAATSLDRFWVHSVWPLQWRFGVGWLCNYLSSQIYTPVLFYFSGAVVAGQMGLSLAISNLLALIAHAWVGRHATAMTQAVARKDWPTLRLICRKDLFWSTGFFLFGAAILCVAHELLARTSYGQRMLPFWPFVGLLGVALSSHLLGVFAAQLRAYQKEPLMWVMVAGAAMTAPLAIWAASRYQAAGVVGTVLVIQAMFTLPVAIAVWRRFIWVRQSN